MSIFKKVSESERNTKATIFVGNIDPKVNETLLYELFIQFGKIKSLNLPKDRILKTHQGFGFIEFKTEADLKYVVQIMKGIRLYGKLLRVKQAENKSGDSKTTTNKTRTVDVGAKLFIKNLNPLVDEKYLEDTFSTFGEILNTSIDREANGESKGQGFVVFNDFTSSDNAIKNINGKILMNSKVVVTYAYKDDKQKTKHGDKVERLLATNAKKHKMLDSPTQPNKKQKR